MSSAADDLVPGGAIDYAEVFQRGGRNLGDKAAPTPSSPLWGMAFGSEPARE